MKLERISIANFRNHRHLEFEPGPSVTVIHGNNGTGKTSILEAIHYCAMTRGLAGSNDRECLSFGSGHFTIRGQFRSDRDIALGVRVAYVADGEKQFFVNEQELTTFSRHIGAIPCVTFTPQEMSVVSGAPAERRRFLDSAISQFDRRYLSDLIQYRKVLQQRNALLATIGERQWQHDDIDVWTEQLAVHAAAIVLARRAFLDSFLDRFKAVFSLIPGDMNPEISYHNSYGDLDKNIDNDSVVGHIIDKYRNLRQQEYYRKQTLAGPHRDDLKLLLDDRDIRKYASQGQQRSYLATMKIALRDYLSDALGEVPLTLLDDLFSELDDKVSSGIMDYLEEKGQVIITSTNEKSGDKITAFRVTD